MRGGGTAGAEVVGRADEAAAEMVHPDPVDHHAGGQGVVGVSQPAGKGQATAGGAGRLGRCTPLQGTPVAEHNRDLGTDRRAGGQRVTATQQGGLDLAGQVVQGADFLEMDPASLPG